MYKLRLCRRPRVCGFTGRPEAIRCVSDLGHVLSLTKIFDNISRAMQFSNMTIRDISFIGFLKLNVFLILLPIFFNRLIGRFVSTANSLSEIRQLPQASQALPPTETVPPDPLALSSTAELFLSVVPALLTPFILTYILAKIVHFLAQNTKVGDIKIGNEGA